MARPRVFISSTYYDLRHIRSSLENFVESLGYDPILSEKGAIAYNPDIPLDESCYRETESCDLFVLIMGGRYGSPSSSDKKTFVKGFFHRYESITKMEYEAAIKKEIPIYILIDKSVYSEYDTFKNNRDNESIKYAHVDSVNVFYLIEKILNQPRNNPIYTFEKHQEIERWLKEQWAGLFKEIIGKRTEKNQIASLSKQVSDLAEINTTLKRYLEEVVSKVSEENAVKIIKAEDKRLMDSKIEKDFLATSVIQELHGMSGFSLENLKEIFTKATTLEEFAAFLEKFAPDNTDTWVAKRLLEIWDPISDSLLKRINEPRKVLGLPPLKFSEQTNKKPIKK